MLKQCHVLKKYKTLMDEPLSTKHCETVTIQQDTKTIVIDSTRGFDTCDYRIVTTQNKGIATEDVMA